jgi:hypothetical protein
MNVKSVLMIAAIMPFASIQKVLLLVDVKVVTEVMGFDVMTLMNAQMDNTLVIPTPNAWIPMAHLHVSATKASPVTDYLVRILMSAKVVTTVPLLLRVRILLVDLIVNVSMVLLDPGKFVWMWMNVLTEHTHAMTTHHVQIFLVVSIVTVIMVSLVTGQNVRTLMNVLPTVIIVTRMPNVPIVLDHLHAHVESDLPVMELHVLTSMNVWINPAATMPTARIILVVSAVDAKRDIPVKVITVSIQMNVTLAVTIVRLMLIVTTPMVPLNANVLMDLKEMA